MNKGNDNDIDDDIEDSDIDNEIQHVSVAQNGNEYDTYLDSKYSGLNTTNKSSFTDNNSDQISNGRQLNGFSSRTKRGRAQQQAALAAVARMDKMLSNTFFVFLSLKPMS